MVATAAAKKDRCTRWGGEGEEERQAKRMSVDDQWSIELIDQLIANLSLLLSPKVHVCRFSRWPYGCVQLLLLFLLALRFSMPQVFEGNTNLGRNTALIHYAYTWGATRIGKEVSQAKSLTGWQWQILVGPFANSNLPTLMLAQFGTTNL